MEVSTGVMLMEAVRAGLCLVEFLTYVGDAQPSLRRVWHERSEP